MISTNSYNKKIQQKLNLLNLDGLDDKLRQYSAEISGSFIPQIILDEYYEDSDIDIYIYGQNIFKNRLPDSPFDRWIVSELGGVYFPSRNYLDVISYKYICPNVILNIIHVKKENIKQYIYSTSDIDICTSTYDGHTLTYHPNILKRKANSINTHIIEKVNYKIEKETLCKEINLCQKTSVAYFNHLCSKRAMRIEKYKRRRFIFPQKSEFEDYDKISTENTRLNRSIYLEIFCLIFRIYLNETLKTYNEKYIHCGNQKKGVSINNLVHLNFWNPFNLNYTRKQTLVDNPFCRKWVKVFGIQEIFSKIAQKNEVFPASWTRTFYRNEIEKEYFLLTESDFPSL
jgi:hypothetical protein